MIPRRWTIERGVGWLMYHYRLARDYERHPHRSEAMIPLALIDLMARRLTGETTPNGLGTRPGTNHRSSDQKLSWQLCSLPTVACLVSLGWHWYRCFSSRNG